MAYSILKQPSIVQTVYQPSYFFVYSSNSANSNFNYFFDVYSIGTGTTSLGRYFLNPRPDGTCQFSPNRIFESQFNQDVIPSTVGFAKSSGCSKTLVVRFGESYGATSTGVTNYENLTAATSYAIGGVASYELAPSWNYNNYWRNYFLTGSTSKFLTNQPSSVYIRDNERATISFMNYNNMTGTTSYNGGTGISAYTVSSMYVTVYRNSGVTATYVYSNPYDVGEYFTGKTTDGNYLVQHFGVGIWNIKQTYPTSINVNTDYKYTIQLKNYAGTNISEEKTFLIDNRCTKYTPIRFMFVNSLGTFDYFTAILMSRQYKNVSRKTYERNLSADYSIGERGATVIDVDSIKSVTVATDWVSQEESDWLQEFFDSTEVYELKTDGTTLPVVINNNSIEVKKTINDKLINYEFDYTYAFKTNTRRG